MKNLKEKTIRGGFARLCAQAANFILRLGSLMVLARLLTPKDFGLVGMVTAFTGVLTLFRDFGLSSAAIQRPTVTQEQLSTLFWINLLVGGVLAVLSVALAPFIAAFYHEPRLIGITDVLALGFLFNAAGVQHSALLQREMRFTALAVINTIGLIIGTAIAIGGARAGSGYWALVIMTVTMPLVSTVGFWIATAWIPGAPRRRSGIRSMVHFGGAITLNGLVAYIATNCDKILLGRFWGVDALGMYGRAYQLVNIPTDNLNQAAGEVAFSALSRLQDDPQRLKNYFLKGYSLVLALTVPITVACALFANDITLVLLGPKWIAGAPILRLLAPTILVFAIANPLFWLLSSLGLVKRSLKMSFVIAPVMVGSYLIGLPYGPQGVALAYSTGMMLWILPLIMWAVRGTTVSVRDILVAVFRPLASSIVAAVVAFGVHSLCGQLLPPFARLALESVALLVTFALMLLFATGQKSLYLDLLRGLKGSSDAGAVSSLEKSEAL
ncbi:MAG: lipopolysaccharide biosynthesis protein [Terracidiphilus sp.]